MSNKSKSSKVEGKFSVPIQKLDTKKMVVYGWASVSKYNGEDVIDLQDDVISSDELRKAAHEFILNKRNGGEMHDRSGHEIGTVVESIVIDSSVAKALGLAEMDKEGWFVGIKINDPDVWDKVEKGQYTALSIGGRGKRTPIQ